MCAPREPNDEQSQAAPSDPRSLQAYWRNLAQPGSPGWKASRWASNMLHRFRHGTTCCGHPGEPGC